MVPPSLSMETRQRATTYLLVAGAVSFVVVVALLLIPTLDGTGSRLRAHESAAVGNLRMLTTLQTEYRASHPEKGFSCELAALKQMAPAIGDYDAYQFLVTESNVGYKFTLIGCEVSSNGVVIRYQATAVPLAPGKSGIRAFCTDQSGALWYDPEGSGTSCLVARRLI